MNGDDLERRGRDADDATEAYRRFLSSPAFQHQVDLAVLVKIAGDDKVDPRERRRAAEVLARLRLQAMEGLASLTGARERALDRMGLKPGPTTLALTQVEQRIEIVRAADWRAAPGLRDGATVHDAEVREVEARSEPDGDEPDGDGPDHDDGDAHDPDHDDPDASDDGSEALPGGT